MKGETRYMKIQKRGKFEGEARTLFGEKNARSAGKQRARRSRSGKEEGEETEDSPAENEGEGEEQVGNVSGGLGRVHSSDDHGGESRRLSGAEQLAKSVSEIRREMTRTEEEETWSKDSRREGTAGRTGRTGHLAQLRCP